jgi:hypothetical protein
MSSFNEPSERIPEQSPHDQALEARLAALRPLEDRLDRDRLMYLAGQAAGQTENRTAQLPRHWAVPASIGAAVGTLAASLILGLTPWLNPTVPVSDDRARHSNIASTEGVLEGGETVRERQYLADSQASLEARLLAAAGGRLSQAANGAQDGNANGGLDVDRPAGSTSRPLNSRSFDDAIRG